MHETNKSGITPGRYPFTLPMPLRGFARTIGVAFLALCMTRRRIEGRLGRRSPRSHSAGPGHQPCSLTPSPRVVNPRSSRAASFSSGVDSIAVETRGPPQRRSFSPPKNCVRFQALITPIQCGGLASELVVRGDGQVLRIVCSAAKGRPQPVLGFCAQIPGQVC